MISTTGSIKTALLQTAAAVILLGAAAAISHAQNVQRGDAAVKLPSAVTASPAYAELLLRRTELESELESLTVEYTDEFPKVQESRQSLVLIRRESERLARVKPAEAGKLTLALGKLIVRKIELEIDMWNLLRSYREEHPDVKRAKKRVDIYETAIKEILG